MIVVKTYEDKEDDDHPLDVQSVEELCKSVFTDQGHADASLRLIITDDESLRKLKKEYFKQDIYTDVIAFNLSDKDELIDSEVYVSIDRVLENSSKFKQSFDNELKRVIVHGILHICGLRDGTSKERDEMTLNEDRLIEAHASRVAI